MIVKANHGIRQVDVMQRLRVPTKGGETNKNEKNRITPTKRKDRGCSGLPANSSSQSSTSQVRFVTNSNFTHNSIDTCVNLFLSLIAQGSDIVGKSRRTTDEKEAVPCMG